MSLVPRGAGVRCVPLSSQCLSTHIPAGAVPPRAPTAACSVLGAGNLLVFGMRHPQAEPISAQPLPPKTCLHTPKDPAEGVSTRASFTIENVTSSLLISPLGAEQLLQGYRRHGHQTWALHSSVTLLPVDGRGSITLLPLQLLSHGSSCGTSVLNSVPKQGEYFPSSTPSLRFPRHVKSSNNPFLQNIL